MAKNILIIAEKPSLAKAIAQFLGGSNKMNKGYIENSQGYKIVWCIGHMYGLAPPSYYNGGSSSYSYSYLPLLPEEWKVIPNQSTKEQMGVIKSLLKGASSIIHAGDPDREGQLIVDEILEDLHCKLPVERIWLNAYDEVSVKRALANLGSNEEKMSMGTSAKARSRVDWLVGMNYSAAFTLAAQKNGYSGGPLSVGRVQTPTLSLVVGRCLEIENHVPIDYFSIGAQVGVQLGDFRALYKVDKTQQGVDSEGRITSQKLANDIVNRVKGKIGKITNLETKQVKELAPLGFNGTSIASLANKKFGYGNQMVLDICQQLYDPALALTTYPRSDCEYLPVSQHADAAGILNHLAGNFPIAAKASASKRGRIYNDKEVTAHHAIVPTLQRANLAALTKPQRDVYELICMRYIAQFFPDYIYDKTSVEVTYKDTMNIDVFQASGRVDIQQGWKDVIGTQKKKDDDDASLPKITQGEDAKALEVSADAKKTKPPAYFTEGTLREAMGNVHLFVTNPEIKKRLKEVAGIGTEATRPSTIETLFKREFIQLHGKEIHDTPTGRDLIKALPETIKDPGMTALWESALDSIVDGSMEMENFISMQSKAIIKIVEASKTMDVRVASNSSGRGGKSGGGRSGSGSRSASSSRSGSKSKPNSGRSSSASTSRPSAGTCPKCKKPMVQRTAKSGPNEGKPFIGCTGYPDCKHTEEVKDTQKSESGKSGMSGFGGKTRSPSPARN